jgi:hypothetical protein
MESLRIENLFGSKIAKSLEILPLGSLKNRNKKSLILDPNEKESKVNESSPKDSIHGIVFDEEYFGEKDQDESSLSYCFFAPLDSFLFRFFTCRPTSEPYIRK